MRFSIFFHNLVENEAEVRALLKKIHDTKPEEHGRGNPDWCAGDRCASNDVMTFSAGHSLQPVRSFGSSGFHLRSNVLSL
jgi:hypothetical protein